ncbi:hypothetical protein Q3G72_013888 [Acer saccharum]|nr:hypothetical protein Q3G72_013888 [Acer saccharum]
MEKRDEKHFVLVHGACHGAWCWYKVATLLKTAGHRVTTLDMAASGTHPSQLHEVPSISDYIKPLTEFMASLPPEERVILVGHSMGGYWISATMESFPEKVSVAVFCTAFMPGPELSYTTLSVEDQLPIFTLAVLLARPLPLYNDEAMWDKAMTLTKDKYGSIPRVLIVCDRDNTIPEDFPRWMIENNPMDDVRLISGSDHMPMISKPKELCFCLQEIVEKYP